MEQQHVTTRALQTESITFVSDNSIPSQCQSVPSMMSFKLRPKSLMIFLFLILFWIWGHNYMWKGYIGYKIKKNIKKNQYQHQTQQYWSWFEIMQFDNMRTFLWISSFKRGDRDPSKELPKSTWGVQRSPQGQFFFPWLQFFLCTEIEAWQGKVNSQSIR